jgi:hypothetical protein
MEHQVRGVVRLRLLEHSLTACRGEIAAIVLTLFRQGVMQVFYESYPPRSKTYETRDGFSRIPVWLHRQTTGHSSKKHGVGDALRPAPFLASSQPRSMSERHR